MLYPKLCKFSTLLAFVVAVYVSFMLLGKFNNVFVAVNEFELQLLKTTKETGKAKMLVWKNIIVNSVYKIFCIEYY